MIEILYQYDPQHAQQNQAPATASAARQELIDGNRAFAEVLANADAGMPTARKVVRLAATDLGLAPKGSEAPEQLPFAAVLSCADARVPVEMVLWQQANDLFVVRVAGNTPGDQSMGSLDYAVNHLPSIQLLVVLGHTGCGAVTAAVGAFLAPASYMGITADLPLRSIVDGIMTAVCGAADALVQVYGEAVKSRPGYRAALVELAVIMNAALTAAAVRQTFLSQLGPNLETVYGVFNLHNHTVGLPASNGSENVWQAGLGAAPQAAADFAALALEMAQSRYIGEHLL
jgi:carbonic anhydrase